MQTSYDSGTMYIYIYNNGKNNIDWSRNHDCDTYIYEYILSHHGMVMQTCMFIKRTWNSETIYILIYIYIQYTFR